MPGDASPGPEPSLGAVRISRHGLAPLYHPDHADGLYGLFAIVNALRLAVAARAPFTCRDTDELMDVGLRFMELRISLRRGVVGGVRLELWRRMADAMVYWTSRNRRMALGLEALFPRREPISREQAFHLLERALRRHRLVLMMRGGGRYTVLTGQTQQSLLLFDSGAAGWIAKRATGVEGDCRDRRHILYPSSFLTLSY